MSGKIIFLAVGMMNIRRGTEVGEKMMHGFSELRAMGKYAGALRWQVESQV